MPEIGDSAMQMEVVVKLAFTIEQRKALRSEYKVYRHLRSKGVHQGITTALGFFSDSEGSACALVMPYAGVPLSTDSRSKLSISDRLGFFIGTCSNFINGTFQTSESALLTLESIHCAGILHADIRPENILISEFGITIIDFGYAKLCDDKRAKDKELARLRHVLGLAGESR
jgi:serine/threonine protein kinase